MVFPGQGSQFVGMAVERYHSEPEAKKIIDEADEMLSQGFQEMIHSIFQFIPKESQVGLFSATFPQELMEITTQFMNQPEQILVKRDQLTYQLTW